MSQRTKGKCKYCGKEYTMGYMNRHLSTCKERRKRLEEESGGRQCGYFLLSITAKYDRDYWLFIEIRDTATLKDLDDFLRDIWLECCGHLSAFDIGGTSYEAMPAASTFWGEPAKSMNYKLKSLLSKGMTIGYEYDFGSTTELLITAVNVRTGCWKKEKITILSRNDPPVYLCSECGKNRQYLSVRNVTGKETVSSAKTAWKFMSAEKICSCRPVIPPRMGVCAYEGSDRYPDRFVPDTEQEG